jgi:hypothetical protein
MSKLLPATRKDLEELYKHEGVVFALFSMTPDPLAVEIGTLHDGVTPAFLVVSRDRKVEDTEIVKEFQKIPVWVRITRRRE